MTLATSRLGQFRYRDAMLALFVAVIFIAGFLPTLQSLHLRWSQVDEAYSHGYLLVAMALYLFFDHTTSPDRTAPGHSAQAHSSRWRYICALLLAAASVGWLLFYLAGITVLQQIMLPLLLGCLAGALGGRPLLARALVPCATLYLAIPLWDELLVPPLQTLSTLVSAWVVKHLFGIAASINGFYIQIPAGIFEIESGCSGLVFFLSALTLGIVYSQFFLHALRHKLLALLIAGLLGLVSNWIRIISLILIGQHTEMQHSLIKEGHQSFGFYIFGGIFLIVIATTNYINKKLLATLPRSTSSASHQLRRSFPRPIGSFLTLFLSLLALTSGPIALTLLRINSEATPHLITKHKIGNILQPMELQPESGFVGAHVDIYYIYLPDPQVTVHFVHYAHPFGINKLLGYKNRAVVPAWQIISSHQLTIDRSPLVLESQIIDDKDNPHLMWSWYKVGDHLMPNASAARWALLVEAAKLRTAGSFISITTPCIFADCALSDQTLRQHAPRILDALTHPTPTAPASR